MTLSRELACWPGKSEDDDGVAHPAVYHMLDVGAVLQALVGKAQLEIEVADSLCLLGTLHDIGKIGSEFRNMIENGGTQSARHWEVSMAWFQHLDTVFFAEKLDGDEFIRRSFYAASAGHHGGPPNLDARKIRKLKKEAGVEAGLAVELFTEKVFEFFPNASLQNVRETLVEASGNWKNCANTLSWWFSGVVSVSDWVGSNSQWFPATDSNWDLDRYWSITKKRAEVALFESGLTAASVSEQNPSALFSFECYTPMQQAVMDVDIPAGPTLAILEDCTGSGKTEAGLILAQRMMQSGKGAGIFFALPTMSTSNAMFSRLKNLKGLFAGIPSIALSHSRSLLHEGFASIVGGEQIGQKSVVDMTCTEWFSDGRRKPLLAQIGVGTIDQALLGVLPTKFCSLRLYALSRSVLIIDEAHDYDPYMQRELEALLSFHSALGGSAILMTATLPMLKRSAFVNAFQRGAFSKDEESTKAAYPQLSIFGPSAVVRSVSSATKENHSRTAVKRIDSLDAAISILVKACKNGSGCAFIRNSVDEAIYAAEILEAQGIKVILHHARFAMGDRLKNENRVLELFGKQGKNRRGCVVVGTQVLEQSLDIDFDLMVTDLAPIGAIIQRAGRLWRHRNERSLADRGLFEPVLYVLSADPELVDDANWCKLILGGGWFVYPLPFLWRTAKVLFEQSEIVMPSEGQRDISSKANIRQMIEAVEGENPIAIPEVFHVIENEMQGQAIAERSHSQQNVLTADEPYITATAIFDDERFPTRLGEEQIIIRLARFASSDLNPWVADVEDRRGWSMSEVSISKFRWEKFSKGCSLHPYAVRIIDEMKEWEQHVYRICPVDSDGQLHGINMQYDMNSGLRISRSCENEPL